MISVAVDSRGFTLVELISVLVIAAVLAAITSSRFVSSTSFELQSTRDQVASAFASAQQIAMSQALSVQLKIEGNAINVIQDINSDGTFDNAENISVDGTQYPLSIPLHIVIDNNTFTFDRLGRTSASSISITHGASSVAMTVSNAGFIE